MRKFEVCKGFENSGVNLPKRSTALSAGYDFECADDVIIPSIWKNKENGKSHKGTLVSTGVKAKMPSDMFLELYSRSSLFNKKGLILGNSVGVIDSDYYNNQENDGVIMFNLVNIGFEDVLVKKGEKIGQGIFNKYYTTDDDESSATRSGGFGSTGD